MWYVEIHPHSDNLSQGKKDRGNGESSNRMGVWCHKILVQYNNLDLLRKVSQEVGCDQQRTQKVIITYAVKKLKIKESVCYSV